MTHFQADVIDWELGVVAAVVLVRFLLGFRK